jgi:hypothetical protein
VLQLVWGVGEEESESRVSGLEEREEAEWLDEAALAEMEAEG